MPAVLDERTQYTDVGGKPIVSGKVYFGVQGADPTVSPITIYSDRALSTVIANPQELDAFGQTANKVWVPGRYSVLVRDVNDVQQYQNLDNGESADKGVTALENVSGGNTITATAASTITAYEDLEQYTFRTAQVNTTAVTLNIDTVGAKSIVKNDGQEINPGEFPADHNIIVSYNLTDDIFQWTSQSDPITIDFYKGSDVATATQPDIWVTDGNTFHFTGTTTVVDLADAPNIGARRSSIADGAFTLTHGSGITLEGSANISIGVGDRIEFYADTISTFSAWVTRADGTAVAAAPDVFSSQLLHVREEQTSGTNAGGSTGGTFHIRVLNTVKTNEIASASLATNQISLPAGTYYCDASAPCILGNAHQLELYNVTDAAFELTGRSAYASSGSTTQTDSILTGRFTIATTKVFELRHYIATSQGANGLGIATSSGQVETYTEAKIWKVG